MKKLIIPLLILFLTMSASAAKAPNGVAIAFVDAARLKGTDREGSIEDFRFFIPGIREVVKRDFPGVEFRFVEQGEMVNLPDGTRFSVTTAKFPLGVILSRRGRKRVELRGVQTEADFACAGARFFRRPSSSCPKP